MRIRKICVEIDEDLLIAAQRALLTTTPEETITEALNQALRVEARSLEVQALSTMCGMDLADQSVMSKAWHR